MLTDTLTNEHGETAVEAYGKPHDLHATARMVGKALRQRLQASDMEERDGVLNLVDEEADLDEEDFLSEPQERAPYWLQRVEVNDEGDENRPAAIVVDAYGRRYEVLVREVR